MLAQMTGVLFFLWLCNIHIHHILFTYPLMDSSVDLLSWHCAWAANDTGLQVLSSEIAELHKSPFSVLKNLPTVFRNCIIYTRPAMYKSSHILHHGQHLLFYLFDNSHSNWGEMISHCMFINISLIFGDVEYILIYTLSICISFKKCSFFNKIGCCRWWWYCYCCLSFCVFWVLIPRSNEHLVNILTHASGCLFTSSFSLLCRHLFSCFRISFAYFSLLSKLYGSC